MADEDLTKLRIEKQEIGGQRRGTRKRLYLAVAILVVLLLVILYWTGVLGPAVTVQVGTVSQVYPSQAFTSLNASGYVVPQTKSALASKMTGRLVWLGVAEGNRVKKGQVVARLENEDVVAARVQARDNVKVAQSNLDQVRAELADASRDLKRKKELVARSLIAQAEYDSALARFQKAEAGAASGEASVKAAQAGFQGAEVQVQYTLIKAPFDAIVLTKNADIGDIVTPIGAAANAKAAVVTIADMDSLQVEADVSESNIHKVRVGQPTEIQLDSIPDVRFPGTVATIVPTADRTKATILVKVRFARKDERILPEMSAKVAFLSRPVATGEEKPFTAMNKGAVARRGGGTVVFVVKDGKAIRTPVDLGAKAGELVEVKSGVKAGQQVVINPTDRLKEGSRVKVGEK